MSTAETAPTFDERPTSRRWLVFALSCGVSFILYVHRYTFLIVRPYLEEEYGFSNSQLETLGSLFYVGYTVAQIPSGIVCDLFGTHVFLGSIVLTWSILTPLIGLPLGFLLLAVIRVLFGLAQAGAYPALGGVTQRWFPRSIRTSLQGWIASFFGRAGGAAAPILMASFLIGYLGMAWEASLVILAAAGIAFGVYFLIAFRTSPEEDPRVNEAELALIREGSRASGASRGMLSFRDAFRNGSIRVMVFQQFFNAGADVIYTNTMGSYFASQGVSMVGVGFLASLPLIGGACGGLFGGYLNEWVIRWTGNRRWARSGIGFYAKTMATVMLVVAMMQRDPVTIAWSLFAVKFFTDQTQPTVWGTCTDLGGRYSATVFSINNTAGNLGAMVVPIALVGPLLDYYSTMVEVNGEMERVTNFTPMFVLMGAAYMIAGICWLFVDCTKTLDEEAG